MEIEEEVYKKLIQVYNKLTLEDFTHLEIRRLQYLVKTKRSDSKVKIFGIINNYKNTKDIYLKVYLFNLLNELEED